MYIQFNGPNEWDLGITTLSGNNTHLHNNQKQPQKEQNEQQDVTSTKTTKPKGVPKYTKIKKNYDKIKFKLKHKT